MSPLEMAAVFAVITLAGCVQASIGFGMALIAAPFYAYWLAEGQAVGLAAGLAVVAIIRHHANIGRLLRGEEPRIGRRSGTEPSSGPVAPPPPR